ncbi:hypothetical protein [Streptomyces minutiscleroticus]|uniref:hypothetical protein n=1 Tax=Streptomyces minutiscleroticus TaxID=68238 RepID=UPI00333129B0
MHIVIAWWDGAHSAGAPHTGRAQAQKSPKPEEGPDLDAVPGLRTSRWLTDPAADRQGLALFWDSATSAARSLPTVSTKLFGCAPSHRWSFEVSSPLPAQADRRSLPKELSLLLHA